MPLDLVSEHVFHDKARTYIASLPEPACRYHSRRHPTIHRRRSIVTQQPSHPRCPAMARAPRLPPVKPPPLCDGVQILSKCMHDRGLRAAETDERGSREFGQDTCRYGASSVSSSRLGPIVRFEHDQSPVSTAMSTLSNLFRVLLMVLTGHVVPRHPYQCQNSALSAQTCLSSRTGVPGPTCSCSTT